MAHIYHPALKEDEIRVMQVETNYEWDDPIVWPLKTVRRIGRVDDPLEHSHANQYEALSYAWGAPTPVRNILLNGESFEIRENLWLYLNQRRADHQEGNIWIDAICIDQNSDLERSTQVAAMGLVYQRAERVVVWLGPGSSGTDAAMTMIAKSSRMDYVPELDHLGELLQDCPYWKRLWIIQELILARDNHHLRRRLHHMAAARNFH